MQANTLPKNDRKVGMITGASSGIGYSLALKISEQFDHLYISSRRISELEKLNDKIIKNNCECTIVPLDLKKIDLLDELASQIFSKEGKLDLLLSAAGINYNLSPVTSIKEDEFRESFEINLLSNLKLLRSFQPILKSSNESKIIVISSKLERKNRPFWGGNDSLVSGLHKIVLTFAEENKNTCISTNIVCPNGVDTDYRNTFMPGEDKSKLMTVHEFAEEFHKLFNNELKSNGKIFTV
ncbi:MAG: SDR family NAD(P)-dependent oxidoreductase [Pelagibacterales bacterium]|nr:SDR family NAD(P)-dependent oxidoreductase [Pelagibacterales bacterium]